MSESLSAAHEKQLSTSEILCRRLLRLSDEQPFTHNAAALEGFGTSLPQHKTLEALFNNSLRCNATTLSIRFERSGLLDILGLRIPLDANPDASLVIQRDPENRNFFATIRTNDKKKNIIPKTRIQMEGFEDFLTRTYNITPPPLDNASYNAWKYTLLDQAQTWTLKEQSLLSEKLASVRTSGSVMLTRETHFSDSNPQDSYSQTNLRHTISLFYPSTTEKFSEELTVCDDGDSRRFGIVQCTPTTREEMHITSETYPRVDALLTLAEQVTTLRAPL